MLRPPAGYRVDQAVATTFTLDLLALLTAPLAFSLFERVAEPASNTSGGKKAAAIEPTALLAAVREHADRLTVFCQAGRIGAPSSYRPLLVYLEQSVVQVTARSEHGVFHPKLWILRMTHPEADTLYRVLVATRNLTFDRSWDTALVLEGPLKNRARGFTRNHPLADLVAELPDLALGEVNPRRRAAILQVADELRRVDFEVPLPFEDLVFHPIGLAKKRPDPLALSVDRLLIVSPFLTKARLDHLTQDGKGHVLVSRADELAKIDPETLQRFESVHILADGAEGDVDDGADPIPGAPPAEVGLHAKLYVGEIGREAHVWTGSANASNAAFEHNVELLVELRGKKKDVGIDRFLDEDSTSLRSVLAPYAVPEALAPGDALAELLDRSVDRMRKALTNLTWTLEVVSLPGESEQFNLELSAAGDLPGPVATATRVWPIALKPDYAQPLSISRKAHFGPCSFAALTSFLAVEITAHEGDRSQSAVFVVPCLLRGAPPHRLARILQTLLDNPTKVLRFLQMLLALDIDDALAALELEVEDASTHSFGRWSSAPLLEALLQALETDPGRIEAFARTIEELGSTPEGAKLLPVGLDAVWPPIRDAARALQATKVAS